MSKTIIKVNVSLSNKQIKLLKELFSNEIDNETIKEFNMPPSKHKLVIDFCELGLLYRERFTSTFRFTSLGKLVANNIMNVLF